MSDAKFFKEVEPIRQFSRVMVRELGFLQAELGELDLSHSYKHALMEMGGQEGMTSNELCERLLLEKSTVSRLLASLQKRGLIEVRISREDRRKKILGLTLQGKKVLTLVHNEAIRQVQGALELLSKEERDLVQTGLSLYSKSLTQSRLGLSFKIRLIQKQDNLAIARVIKTVMPEFGAIGAGFAIQDSEVNDMYGSYSRKGHRYFVILRNDKVVGGGGIGPLLGGPKGVCELRKMYFLPELRGFGFGQKLLGLCLQSAKDLQYRQCYLETLKSMKLANFLYQKNGFKTLSAPMGNTGHYRCDAFYLKEL